MLALALHMPVSELQSRMTSAEFQEWRAYYQIEPFGDFRDDFRIGILDSIVSNLMLGKNDERANPIDFVIHGSTDEENVITADDDQDEAGAPTQSQIDAQVAAEARHMMLTLERQERLKHGDTRPT